MEWTKKQSNKTNRAKISKVELINSKVPTCILNIVPIPQQQRTY